MVVKEVQSSKVNISIEAIPTGILIEFNEEQPKKAAPPIVVTPAGISMVVKEVQ